MREIIFLIIGSLDFLYIMNANNSFSYVNPAAIILFGFCALMLAGRAAVPKAQRNKQCRAHAKLKTSRTFIYEKNPQQVSEDFSPQRKFVSVA